MLPIPTNKEIELLKWTVDEAEKWLGYYSGDTSIGEPDRTPELKKKIAACRKTLTNLRGLNRKYIKWLKVKAK